MCSPTGARHAKTRNGWSTFVAMQCEAPGATAVVAGICCRQIGQIVLSLMSGRSAHGKKRWKNVNGPRGIELWDGWCGCWRPSAEDGCWSC